MTSYEIETLNHSIGIMWKPANGVYWADLEEESSLKEVLKEVYEGGWSKVVKNINNVPKNRNRIVTKVKECFYYKIGKCHFGNNCNFAH